MLLRKTAIIQQMSWQTHFNNIFGNIFGTKKSLFISELFQILKCEI